MSKKYNNKKGKYKSNKFTDAERLAYTLGLIERGKKNPESKIFDSYQKGLSGQTTRRQKPIA